jgi:hypothetical protein
MQVITIPCAPLTRKILLTQYGPAEPIHLGKRDLLYRQLSFRGSPRKMHERYQQVLTSSISIEVHRHLAERMQVDVEDVGYHLYDLHKHEMFLWVAGKVSLNDEDRGVNVQQKAAIKQFLDTHHVEEDDFSLDTACRIWQRWRESRVTNTPRNVLQMLPGRVIRLSWKQAHVAAQKASSLARFILSHMHHHTVHTVPVYILYRHTDYTYREVARELNREFLPCA